MGLIPIGRVGDDRQVQEELIAVLPDGRTFTLGLTYRRASPSRWQVAAVQMHPVRRAEPAIRDSPQAAPRFANDTS